MIYYDFVNSQPNTAYVNTQTKFKQPQIYFNIVSDEILHVQKHIKKYNAINSLKVQYFIGLHTQ